LPRQGNRDPQISISPCFTDNFTRLEKKKLHADDVESEIAGVIRLDCKNLCCGREVWHTTGKILRGADGDADAGILKCAGDLQKQGLIVDGAERTQVDVGMAAAALPKALRRGSTWVFSSAAICAAMLQRRERSW
jgi:hypothetical protein